MVKRAGWRIDLKWVSGIIFTLALFLTLIFYNLSQLSAEKQAKEIFSPVIKGMIKEMMAKSVGGNYSQLQTLAQTYPDQEVKIPGLPWELTIKASDITGRSEAEFQDYLSGVIFETAYQTGLSNELLKTQGEEENLGFFASLIGLFSRPTHFLFRTIFIISLAISLVFLLPFVLFSYRFGKLTNPGLSLFVVGFPEYLLFSVLKFTSRGFFGPQASGIELTTPLTKMLEIAQGNYFKVLILGIVIIFLGGLGGLIYLLRGPSSGDIVAG